MGAAVEHRFEFKGIYPFRCMAFIADSDGGLLDIFRITGIDMKAAQEDAPRVPVTGKLANQPVQVEDDLAKIVKVLGVES